MPEARAPAADCGSAASHRRVARSLAVALVWLAVLAACGGSSTPPAARPYEDPGMVDGGHYRMYYALTLTEDLPSEIAGSYGIKQRRNLALLTIATQARQPEGTLAPVTIPVQAERVGLLGDRRQLALRATGPGSWIALVEVADREAFSIELRADAGAAMPALQARMTREFDLD